MRGDDTQAPVGHGVVEVQELILARNYIVPS
jgi:hypothetical protein